MRQYEVMFMMRPDVSDAQADEKVNLYKGYLEQGGARLLDVERKGRRRTAYVLPQLGLDEAYYVLFHFEGDGRVNAEIERRMKLDDGIIRFLILRTDDEMRYAEKQRKLREAERAKRPARGPRPDASGPRRGHSAPPSHSSAPASTDGGAPSPTEVS